MSNDPAATALRAPAVAGLFYPAGRAALEKDVRSRLAVAPSEATLPIAVMAPHAGYIYSGSTAGKLYGRIRIPRRIVLIGPNHTGLGALASVSPSSAWTTPLGEVEVDAGFRERLLASDPILELDASAHWREHALEVQLPFLQCLRRDLAIVPITLGPLRIQQAMAFGRALAGVIRSSEGETLVVASSDMNHYESEETTLRKDQVALRRLLALDPVGLFRDVEGCDISMCGVVPATVALAAALELGAARSELVDHTTSGEVSGDFDQVVGYASATIY